MTIIKRSRQWYPNSPEKQAVVDRLNAVLNERMGQEVDWGWMLAELIEAYHGKPETTFETILEAEIVDG